jgi:hypothetical protein
MIMSYQAMILFRLQASVKQLKHDWIGCLNVPYYERRLFQQAQSLIAMGI